MIGRLLCALGFHDIDAGHVFPGAIRLRCGREHCRMRIARDGSAVPWREVVAGLSERVEEAEAEIGALRRQMRTLRAASDASHERARRAEAHVAALHAAATRLLGRYDDLASEAPMRDFAAVVFAAGSDASWQDQG